MKIFIILIILLILIFYLKKNESFKSLNEQKKLKVINFNTTWCGYSKNFAPMWDTLTDTNINSNVEFVDIKCDDPKNNNICQSNKYQVSGFPQIMFEDYKGNILSYNGPRTIENINLSIKNILQDL